jgi:hypothetical protein
MVDARCAGAQTGLSYELSGPRVRLGLGGDPRPRGASEGGTSSGRPRQNQRNAEAVIAWAMSSQQRANHYGVASTMPPNNPSKRVDALSDATPGWTTPRAGPLGTRPTSRVKRDGQKGRVSLPHETGSDTNNPGPTSRSPCRALCAASSHLRAPRERARRDVVARELDP